MRFTHMLGAALVAAAAAGQENPLHKMKVEQIYQNICSACHGKEFEGGRGGVLNDGEWRFGSTDKDLYRSIAKGNPEMGMDAWESMLSDEQIRALVIFLREKEKEARYRKTAFPKPAPAETARTQHHVYRLETVTEGLDIPWALAFLPDGRRLVTERAGALRVLEADGRLNPKPVEGTPPVVHHGQGGLMDVALHPGYATNGWIYLALADDRERDGKPPTLTALCRGRIKDLRWTDHEWIYRPDEKFYTSAGVHFGSRIAFAPPYVFFVVGERSGLMQAQDLRRPNGKIFRLFDDGRVPPDNPFAGTPDAEPGIWSYGHRNPQGLAFDPRHGDLYATEHGPRGGDEFNLIRKGANYGWPVITYGMNYDGTPITAVTEKEGMEQPVIYWTPSIAACGLAFYAGDKFPRWKNDFFAGGLASKELRRLRVRDRKVVEQEVVLKDAGRVRDVRAGPDGLLYVVLNGPDRIVRLVPVD